MLYMMTYVEKKVQNMKRDDFKKIISWSDKVRNSVFEGFL